MINNYSRVRLLTNDHADEGACRGDLGYIIEVYDDAYEVEFSDGNGITFAQIVAQPNEIELDEPGQTVPRVPKDASSEENNNAKPRLGAAVA